MNRRIGILIVLLLCCSFLQPLAYGSTSKIASIKDLVVTVYVDQSYQLPAKVDAVMTDKTTQKVAVKWNPASVSTKKVGTFTYKGSVIGYSKIVNLKLTVIALPSEVKSAISYGFVPKELQNNLTSTITYAQYSNLLKQMIQKYQPSALNNWNQKVSLAQKSNTLMKRDDGMLLTYVAALALGFGTSEEEFTNGNWQYLHQLCGEKAWNQFSWKYPLIPKWDQNTKLFNGNLVTNAYFFCMGQYSNVSGKILFDYDEKNYTMNINKPFTREAAICAAARLYESTTKFVPVERIPSTWDALFMNEYKAQLSRIMTYSSDIQKSDQMIPGKTYTGTAYYISNDGNDNNDGKSPEQAWANISRLSNHLQKGDAVFFKCGDIWREELQCEEGVTYSSFGVGDKPRFYGSQENGADAQKWTLWFEDPTGKKIWKYHKDIYDCGGIVFNDGKSHANRVFSYWNGKMYTYTDNHSQLFNPVDGLKYDLQFYSTFDVQNRTLPIYVYNEDSTGPLYLRCDAGNPGTIFQSIEFQTAPKKEAGYAGIIKAANDCVIDNLSVRYGVSRGIATHEASHVLIQNCEVAWIGGGTHEINLSGYIPVSGEGIGIEGSYNTAQNCYVHDCFDGGIISELRVDFPYYVSHQVIQDNIIERCMSGVLIVSHDENRQKPAGFGDVLVARNLILYSGYGWSCDPHYDFTWGDENYLGNAITFWDKPNINNGVQIIDNTLYLAKSALIHLSMDASEWPDFQGNQLIQNKYGKLCVLGNKIATASNDAVVQEFIRLILGDKTGKYIQPNP